MIRDQKAAFEQVVYVGTSLSESNRFKNGHKAALLLLDPKYDGFEKLVYFAEVAVHSAFTDVTYPVEVFKAQGREIVKSIEALLIFSWFKEPPATGGEGHRHALLPTGQRGTLSVERKKYISHVRFVVKPEFQTHPFPPLVPFPFRVHICRLCPCSMFARGLPPQSPHQCENCRHDEADHRLPQPEPMDK